MTAPAASWRLRVVIFGLGLSAGLPAGAIGALLVAVVTDAGLDPGTIGALAAVGLPYTLKFTWAPLLDRYTPPWLGRRRGWIFALQCAIAAALATMGTLLATASLAMVALCAVGVALLSASQDVVIDAYVREACTPAQRAAGGAAYVLGYRVALLLAGPGALGLAAYAAWSTIYGAVAALVVACTLATWFAVEPTLPPDAPRRLVDAVWRPLRELAGRRPSSTVVALLAFVALYRFGDALAGTVTLTFYQRHLGFSWGEIAALAQALGFLGTALGATAAARWVPRLGVRRALVVFGAAQAATNLLLAALASVGPSRPMLGCVVFIDGLAGALGTGALVTLLLGQSRRAYAATQAAIFTGLSSVGARVFGFLAGPLVATFGWGGFYVATALIALPGLALVAALPRTDAEAG